MASLPLSLEKQKVRAPTLSLSGVQRLDLLCSCHTRVIEDVPALVLSLRNTPVVAATGPSRVRDDSRQVVDRVDLVGTRPVSVEIESGGERDRMLVLTALGVEALHLEDDNVG